MQGLLDVVQPELVDTAQKVEHFQRVGRVGVDGELDGRELGANRGEQVDVPARLDLQLDPLVALLDVAAHIVHRVRQRRHAEACPDRDLGALATQQSPQWHRRLAGVAVPHGQLERGLGHRVAPPAGPAGGQLTWVGTALGDQLRAKGGAQQVQGAGDRLLPVHREGIHHPLAVALHALGTDGGDDRVLFGFFAERGLER